MNDAKKAYVEGAQAYANGQHCNPYCQDKTPAHFAEWAAGYMYARDVTALLSA